MKISSTVTMSNSRFEMAEESIIEREDTSVEIVQTEEQRGKGGRKRNRASETWATM